MMLMDKQLLFLVLLIWGPICCVADTWHYGRATYYVSYPCIVRYTLHMAFGRGT